MEWQVFRYMKNLLYYLLTGRPIIIFIIPFRSLLPGPGEGQQGPQADFYLTPDYLFRDINLKYSGGNTRSNYYLSLYGGRDNFSYDFKDENLHRTITLNHNEKNNQIGGTLFYGLSWKAKNTSNFIVSFSSLQTDQMHDEDIIRTSGQQTDN